MPFQQAEVVCEKRCFIRPQINGMGEEEEMSDKVGEEEEEREDEEQEEEVEEEEEARKPRVPRRPVAPTKAEIEEHEVTHLPPRDWCPHCVAGHGISNQHRASKETEEDKIGITVGLDYCFMREGREKRR